MIADIGILGYSYIDSQGREIFHNYYDKPIEEVAYGTLYNLTYLGTSDVVRQITGVTMIVRSYSGWTKGIMPVYAL